MLELLTISDIYSPYGFAVIDPHGDYAINILKRIPKERVKTLFTLIRPTLTTRLLLTRWKYLTQASDTHLLRANWRIKADV